MKSLELLIGSLEGQFGIGALGPSMYAHGGYRRAVEWTWFDNSIDAQHMLDTLTKMQVRAGNGVRTRLVNGNVAWVRG